MPGVQARLDERVKPATASKIMPGRHRAKLIGHQSFFRIEYLNLLGTIVVVVIVIPLRAHKEQSHRVTLLISGNTKANVTIVDRGSRTRNFYDTSNVGIAPRHVGRHLAVSRVRSERPV